MTVKEAIERADSLRLNSISDEQKAAWIIALDGQVAEMFHTEPPANNWPTEDRELLIPFPYDEVYQLYLICKIDYYNQDMKLYANDMEMYTAALAEAQAWYRRTHRQCGHRNWKVM